MPDDGGRRASAEVRLVTVGNEPLPVRDVVALARGEADVRLDPSEAFCARIAAGANAVLDRVAKGPPLYGVTTGFGESCDTEVSADLAEALQANLVAYHGCGTGPSLSDEQAAAVLAVRLCTLCRGWSGVRPELLDALAGLLQERVLPVIPSRGSVGASGDLTPLSYVAAVLTGEREASWQGHQMPADEALARAGLAPITLAPKEGLALMNGTSVMTGLGALAWSRARALARWACSLTAIAADCMRTNPEHFDPRLDAVKPHRGQRVAAAWIREDLGWPVPVAEGSSRLQARYSIRCAPHVIGVLLDACDVAERILDTEIRSVNDNPIVDVHAGEFVHGGNFYGGHVAWALDGLKTAVTNVAALLERQLVLLSVPATSGGLPANLVDASRQDAAAMHGFKAMQITASSLVAEAAKLCMPASVFSRSTESHNQDIVSMGTHSARDCTQVLELAEDVAAIATAAVCQGTQLRASLDPKRAEAPRARSMLEAVRGQVDAVRRDRRQDLDIARIVEMHRAYQLPIGAWDSDPDLGPGEAAT